MIDFFYINTYPTKQHILFHVTNPCELNDPRIES